MSIDPAYLGRGWAFPPSFDPASASVEMVAGLQDIRQSLTILLSTGIGERLLQPTYGCDLKRMTFEPVDTSYRTYLKDLVSNAVLYHEPRVVLEDVRVETHPEEGRVDINVCFRVRGTNSRDNLVYPFYIDPSSDSLG